MGGSVGRTGQPTQWREAFYYHYYGVATPRADNWLGSHEIIGVRTATAKLIYYPQWKQGSFWEYFDLTTDPREMHNLYREPAHQKAAAALKDKLRQLAACYQDAAVVRALEQEPESGRGVIKVGER